MQARLKELEEQLERAKAQNASEFNASDGFQSEDTPQAMSEWVKGALGEANTIVRGNCEDGSWRGLGSWVRMPGQSISENVLSSTDVCMYLFLKGSCCWPWHWTCYWGSCYSQA